MLKPAARGAIGNALVRGWDVPLPEEGDDLAVKGFGTTGLDDDAGVGRLFDRCLGNPLPPVLDISFALPAGVGASGAIWDLEVALEHASFQRVGRRG